APSLAAFAQTPVREGMRERDNGLIEPGIGRTRVPPRFKIAPKAPKNDTCALYPATVELILPLKAQPRRYEQGNPSAAFSDRAHSADGDTRLTHANLIREDDAIV